jgi:PAS domain S-box-containing protein
LLGPLSLTLKSLKVAKRSQNKPTVLRNKGLVQKGDLDLATAKLSIKEILEKQQPDMGESSRPDIAIEVIDEKIEEGKPVEQALVAEHLFRKAIEDAIPAGIAGFDMSGRQIYVNDVFCDMVGWPETELIGRSFPQPYWAYQESAGQPVFEKIFSSETFEIKLQPKLGEKRWYLVYSNVLSDSTGAAIGRLISIADIEAQKRSENALRRLSTQLIDAQEQERKHISRDLHDSISGKLAGIKYSLEKVIAKMAPELDVERRGLQETVAAVRSALAETQRITKNLHPAVLDDLGLNSAMRGHCREFQQLYPSIQVQLELGLEEQVLDASLEILVYRVLQEALNNVAKHSKADRVDISLRKETGFVRLTITDNGTGFSLSADEEKDHVHKKLGLENMRERTELFGGELCIETQPGQGTRLAASWPLVT